MPTQIASIVPGTTWQVPLRVDITTAGAAAQYMLTAADTVVAEVRTAPASKGGKVLAACVVTFPGSGIALLTIPAAKTRGLPAMLPPPDGTGAATFVWRVTYSTGTRAGLTDGYPPQPINIYPEGPT